MDRSNASNPPRRPELRTGLMRERFPLLVDGEAEMAPANREPITSGQLRVSLGSQDHPEAEARLLAAVLTPGPLAADGHIQATR